LELLFTALEHALQFDILGKNGRVEGTSRVERVQAQGAPVGRLEHRGVEHGSLLAAGSNAHYFYNVFAPFVHPYQAGVVHHMFQVALVGLARHLSVVVSVAHDAFVDVVRVAFLPRVCGFAVSQALLLGLQLVQVAESQLDALSPVVKELDRFVESPVEPLHQIRTDEGHALGFAIDIVNQN